MAADRERTKLLIGGAEVRTLGELRKAYCDEDMTERFRDGTLQSWLNERYFDDEAEAAGMLDDDEGLADALRKIFGVERIVEDAKTAERRARLAEFTDDEKILAKAELSAFDQDELIDRYDEGRTEIILVGDDFEIPRSKSGLTYIKLPDISDSDCCEPNVDFGLSADGPADDFSSAARAGKDAHDAFRREHDSARELFGENISDEISDIAEKIICSGTKAAAVISGIAAIVSALADDEERTKTVHHK